MKTWRDSKFIHRFVLFLPAACLSIIFWELSTRRFSLDNSLLFAAACLAFVLYCGMHPQLFEKPTVEAKYTHHLLRAFRYFCSRSSRESVDLTIHDLNLDIKEMRAESRSEWFIRFVVIWRSGWTIVALIWAAILEPILKARKSFKG